MGMPSVWKEWFDRTLLTLDDAVESAKNKDIEATIMQLLNYGAIRWGEMPPVNHIRDLDAVREASRMIIEGTDKRIDKIIDAFAKGEHIGA